MKKILFFAIIALGATLVSCNKPAAVSEEKVEASQPASEQLAAVRVANDLAKYGYEAESASALIEAANILAGVPTQALEATKENTGVANPTKDEKSLTVESLLADAKDFAAGDETLLAMVAKVEQKYQPELTRGRVGGPATDYDRVEARSYVQYYITFRGGEFAEVAVVGDGDTDLDLYIYDENGNLIDSDIDYTDACYCSFVPSWTGSFRVKIVNRGSVYNRYTLITN